MDCSLLHCRLWYGRRQRKVAMDEEQPNHQKKDQDEVLHNLGKELSSYWCGAERNHGQEDHGEQNKDLYGLL